MSNNVKVQDAESGHRVPVKTRVVDGVHIPVYDFNTDSANFDAFDRLRVSNPETLFDSKLIHNNGAQFYDDQEVSGGGMSSTWSQDTASVVMGVSDSTAGNRTRQSFMCFNYQPGKSQLILCTGTLQKSGGGAGITRGFGYVHNNNGLYLHDNEGTIQLVKRSYATGAAVNTAIDQADWNIDTMDGNGDSGIELDFTKSQILIIDFEWLGVGRVRMGFVIDGVLIYAHQFVHANNLEGVYMSTPNLPIRYWIDNDGTGGAAEIEHICSSVMSEGGTVDLGVPHTETTGVAFVNANTAGTVYAVYGIRLRSANLDSTVKIQNVHAMVLTSDDYYWELRLNPTVANAPTFADHDATSVIQVATGDTVNNPSNTTVTGGHVIDAGYVKGGNTVGSISEITRSQLRLGSAIDGTPDEIWLVVTPITANADVLGGISWLEL